jgi:UDP-2,3-diacylglucosamine pyrophosphatase LpxH
VSAIRWVCISDLHLGALNSLLTNVTADGERVDATAPSPVLTALGECLRALRQPGQDPPELIVLGDLFELALTAPEDASATFAQFIAAVRPGQPDAAVAPALRFVPGNHDHHLWSRATDDRYMRLLEEGLVAAQSPSDRHATHLLPANDRVPVRDRFIEILAKRGNSAQTVTVEQSYPNLGLVGDGGKRAVILSHGHFIEPLYRMMSLLDTVFGSPRAGAVEAWQLEADNGGWIDFFWSSMGDSGDIMRVTRTLYESLQSHEAMHAEIEAIERAIKAAGAGRGRSDLEAHTVSGLLRACVGTAVRERHRPGITLSPHAEEGLLTYLSGAVATQSAAEIGHPEDVTFVFGHTHKPFIESRTTPAFATPVQVVNTGGWVVDTPQRNPLKGASLILIDDQLNVASLCCYTEGDAASSYRLRIDPVNASGPNDLVDQLRATIDPDRDPWAQFAQALQSAVSDRGQQLEDRLRSDASTLNQLNVEDDAHAETK